MHCYHRMNIIPSQHSKRQSFSSNDFNTIRLLGMINYAIDEFCVKMRKLKRRFAAKSLSGREAKPSVQHKDKDAAHSGENARTEDTRYYVPGLQASLIE